jgi:hypothetical protein
MASLPPAKSQRLQTAYKALDTYKTLSPEQMLQSLSESYTHQVLPESLNMPARNRTEFAAHAMGITGIFSSFSMDPITVFEDADQNAVVAHCRMNGQLARGLGPWVNTCVIFMRFSEDGKEIVSWTEFVDSARAGLLRQKLMGSFDKNLDKKGGHGGGLGWVQGAGIAIAGIAIAAGVGLRMNWFK